MRDSLAENRFQVGVAEPSTSILPDGHARLQRGYPCGEFALADQCNSKLATYQYLCHKRKAVFAGHSLAFFDALEQLLRLADVLENQCAIRQTRAQVERMPDPARMELLGVVDLYGLLGIAAHPGRKRHPE
ncbi:hypothetical protein [Bradyrhizobium sp. CB2312]|uniref:hypothetical protein n=1 Tax=Bradyrhizobium sp. CB2312 TaxID=3039155 RepID=UPI0024B22616|nr:hypothetical protein [Bradyrhizobium sp. CB2312]WFU74839.1 hypothetical protein QA642_12685 [Bradyrhizobium sp. CB2312]